MSLDPITISALIGVGKDLISRIWKDPQQQAEELRKLAELEQTANLEQLSAYIQVLRGQYDVVKTEAQSEHWLTANWRPITMLTFVVIIVLRMFGLTHDSITENEYLKLWGMVEIGLGGYVVSRGVEKGIRLWKE